MGENRDNTKVANKILKVLKQISEHLTQDEIITLRSSVTKALELSRVDFNNVKAKEFLRVHVKALQFRSGISVYLLKQSIRSLLMIIHNVALGEDVYERFTKYVVREHPSIVIGMELDDELLKAYFKALESGHEYAKHIRLMVVGMYHVGKTTLVHKLLNKPDAEKEHPSTAGIDISVKACEIDEDGEWKITEFKDKEEEYIHRLQELFESDTTDQKKRRKKTAETIYTRQDQKPNVIKDNKEKPSAEKQISGREIVYDKCKNEFKEEADTKKVTGSTPFYNKIELANRNARKSNVAIKRPTITMWDFAGQSVYYSTHHFFLNPRAIYLLVLDLSKGLHDELKEDTDEDGTTKLHLGKTTKHFTQLEAFQFWMRSIYIYTQQKQSSTDRKQYQPKIILIGTHKDKVDKKKDPDIYAQEYFTEALDSVKGIRGLEDLICQTRFFFGKGESLEKIDALRSEIYEVAKNQSTIWNEKIPGKFIPLERLVEKQKSDNNWTMRFSELEKVSTGSYFPLTKDEIQVFLKFQHAFGNILYYDMANPGMVILKPQWLIDAFKLFITHKRKPDFKEFYTQAKLSDRFVNSLLSTEGNWIECKDEILKYMEFLDIIAKPVMFKGYGHDEDTQATTSQLKLNETVGSRWFISITTCEITSNEDFYLMPCVLPPRPHADELRQQLILDREERSPVLCMYIGGVFLPPFIFHRILATCIKKMPLFERNNKYVLYNGIGAFNIDATTILTIWSVDDMIYLKVTSCHRDGKSKAGKKRIDNADLTEVQKYFDSLVRQLFQIGGHQHFDKFKISYYITCPECLEMFPFDRTVDNNSLPFDPLVGMFEVAELLQLETAVCKLKSHHVTRHECLTQWFDKKPPLKKLEPVLLERLSKTKPDNLILADITDKIDARRINDLAERLDIAHNHLSNIELAFGKPASCYIFHILHMWSKRKSNIVQLYEVATELGCSEDDFKQILDGTDSDYVKEGMEYFMKNISPEKLDAIVLNEINIANIAAASIGKDYWLFFIRLGLAEMLLQTEICTSSDDKHLIIRKLLKKWLKQSELPNKEQNYQLIRAMVKCDCDMNVLLEIFK